MTARTLPEAMRDNRILHWNFCFSCAFSSMRGEDLNWKWPAPTPPSSRTVAAHRPEPARLGVHRVKGAEGSARSECIIMFDCIPKVQKKIEKGEPTTPSSLLPPRPMMRTASGLFFCPIARKNLLPLPRNLNAHGGDLSPARAREQQAAPRGQPSWQRGPSYAPPCSRRPATP
jgi:hypothetical protein